MLDVLLVVPPYYYKSKALTSSVKEYAGVGSLAAILREQGYQVEILDADLAGYDPLETVEAISKRTAAVIGFTMLQVAAVYAIEIVKLLRATDITSHITVGGHFPTFAPQEVLEACPGIDSIVLGEGEETLLELVQTLEKQKDWTTIPGIAHLQNGTLVSNACRPLIADLDSLPFQSRDTLPEILHRGGPGAIITSRGCYGNCGFCSVNAFYKKSPGPKWRGRSPEHVGRELEWLVNEFGANVFVFNDDNFFGPGNRGKDRARQIGEEILKRGLKIHFAVPAAVNDVELSLFQSLREAGLRSVFLGVESMRQDNLRFLNKHTTVEQNEETIALLEKLKIFYQIGFILFYPESTLEDIEYNLTYVRDKILHNPYCGTQVFTGDLRILHGTMLEESLKDKAYVQNEGFYYSYKIQDPLVDQLRDIIDRLIFKKTFPLMINCKEEFMMSSMQRNLRTDIAHLQITMALAAIRILRDEGELSGTRMKQFIRELNAEVKQVEEKISST